MVHSSVDLSWQFELLLYNFHICVYGVEKHLLGIRKKCNCFITTVEHLWRVVVIGGGESVNIVLGVSNKPLVSFFQGNTSLEGKTVAVDVGKF